VGNGRGRRRGFLRGRLSLSHETSLVKLGCRPRKVKLGSRGVGGDRPEGRRNYTPAAMVIPGGFPYQHSEK
jgi:hypothetical protein